MCLFECFLYHFGSETADFEIHLDSGDALVGTGYLEVHIAEEVLETLDIDHGHPALTLGDQAAGDTGDRRLDRHTGVHQRQSGAADGALRSGAVGGEYLGDKAQCIREVLNGRDHRQQRSFCEGAVTDLTSAGAAAGLGLAN